MTRVTVRRLDVFVKKFYGNLAKYVGISYSERIIAMSGRIFWLGVFMRLVGAIAVVLLTYNPGRLLLLSLGDAGLRCDYRSESVCRGTAAGRMDRVHPYGICCLRSPRARIERARARHLGLDAPRLRDHQP